MSHPAPKVVVVGSLNIDYIAAVKRLPVAGETVFASDLVQRFGGKGANQAIAAARQGAQVSMIGCVGADDHGRAYCQRLQQAGIDISGISTTDVALTGTALIAVDERAENIIIVAPGANGRLTPAAIVQRRSCIASAKAVLLQQEIPSAAVLKTIEVANGADVPVILNPSPLRDNFPWGKYHIDTLIANAGEAQSIFGLPLKKSALPAWQDQLAKRKISRLVVTRGAKPTLCLENGAWLEIPALAVKPVDTVGAGDAFAGAFTALRAEGADVATALRHANCAGALATLKSGAQESIPFRRATEKAFRSLS